jgi:hypothetical protein
MSALLPNLVVVAVVLAYVVSVHRLVILGEHWSRIGFFRRRLPVLRYA